MTIWSYLDFSPFCQFKENQWKDFPSLLWISLELDRSIVSAIVYLILKFLASEICNLKWEFAKKCIAKSQ